ncbi:MAG TPA: PhzF family phenazine biosynthesis protein [Gemmatimonadales bacterium]|nr:PhzF family phenazine biosynthesis protein [Gemmatimonadales bacterium]HRZ09833.1 PhzF family phenazine biosynthesis protein [Gemmatimonadales bacterium]
MPLQLFHIDAFTDRPFAGNPAAVCLLEKEMEAAWMQAVAQEMNLSETAFLLRRDDGFGLRWFTPEVEVALCGHATLASAHFLWAERHLEPRAVARFHTQSGLLTAVQRDGWIELDFPAQPALPAPAPAGMAAALGGTPVATLKSDFDFLVEVATEAEVRAMEPDFRALRVVNARGVIVTAACTEGPYDFVSRFFGPAVGIDEDPVTGSAHCVLGPYWQARLGKSSFLAFQASARGGEVRVEVQGDRVKLGGKAVTVSRGELL